MRLRYGLLVLAVLAGVPSGGLAQEGPMHGSARGRERLEQQVLQRFSTLAAGQLGLDESASRRLNAIVLATAQKRMDMAREAAEVRRRLATALQPGSDATDADFHTLLDELGSLRAREMDLWKQENQELARILSPRQQAEFMALRARFNDRVMRMRQGRGPGPGGGFGPGDVPPPDTSGPPFGPVF